MRLSLAGMRTIAIVLVALVAGCGVVPDNVQARRICERNGHVVGTEGFDRCFATTYAAVRRVGAVIVP